MPDSSGMPSHREMMIKVSIFAVAMLLVSAGLVVVFGDFRFGPESTYHATFTDVSRLKAGQKVRIAGCRSVLCRTSSSIATTPST